MAGTSYQAYRVTVFLQMSSSGSCLPRRLQLTLAPHSGLGRGTVPCHHVVSFCLNLDESCIVWSWALGSRAHARNLHYSSPLHRKGPQ